MHTIEIPDKKIVLQIPANWDDCTAEQVHFILSRAFKVMEGTLAISEFRIQAFKYLSGLKFGLGYLIKHRLGLNQEANGRIYQLSHQLCDWIFVKKDDNYELSYETVQNFFPALANSYHGPEALLSDLTLLEFKTALGALDLFFESKDFPEEAMTHLDYFIAILYRPRNEKGSRVPFHNYISNAEPFHKVPLWQKQAIVIWFTYCVKCLQSEDLVINGIECNFEVLFPTSSGTNNNKVNLGWTGILLDIAESGVFGDARSAGQTSLYDVLLFMLKKHQDQPKNDKS